MPNKKDLAKEVAEEMAAKKWILVPVFGQSEKDVRFIDEISSATKVVLLFVVDQKAVDGIPTGFIGGRIKSGEETIEEIKKRLPGAIEVKDYVEWGVWEQKIENTALLEHVDEIIMANDKKSRKIAEQLEEKGLKVRLI